MTESQNKHLQLIKDEFVASVDWKYRNGAAEHGGDLQDMEMPQLMDNCMSEVIDLYTYLNTLEKKVIRHEKEIHTLKFIITNQRTLIEGLTHQCNDYKAELSRVESIT